MRRVKRIGLVIQIFISFVVAVIVDVVFGPDIAIVQPWRFVSTPC